MSFASYPFASLLLLIGGLFGSADEQKIPLADVPKVVLDAVKAKYPGGELKEATKETGEDEVIYEIVLTNAGKAVTVSLDAKGEIEEIETELAVSELPAAVREAVTKKYPGSKISKAEELVTFEDGNPETAYEVQLTTAEGKSIELKVEANGEIEDESDEG